MFSSSFAIIWYIEKVIPDVKQKNLALFANLMWI